MIRLAEQKDKDWILSIFAENKTILGGKGYGSLQWKRYWDNEKDNERWIVIEDRAFCHYLIRKKDKVKVVYEIATANEHKRHGFGKKLIKFIGDPIELKTDYDSKESNEFYKKTGFLPLGVSYTKSNNKKMMNYKK
jgi:GNAT superfamily N-acetyltransferase